MENNEVKHNGMAKASLVLGIVAMSTCFLPIVNNASFVMGVLAAIFGIIALVKKQKKGKAIAGLVLGVLATIITISLQNSWSKALDDLSDNLSGKKTDEILEKNVDVTFGSFVGTVDEWGIADTELPVTVTNKSSENKSFSIQIEAIDANGTRIDSDLLFINSLGPGQSQSEKAFTFVSSDQVEALKSATFKVVEISMY